MTVNTSPQMQFCDATRAPIESVVRLADWSVESGEMIPLTYSRILRHRIGLLGFLDGNLAGYAAVTEVYSPSVIEVGGLVVNPDMRRRGIGTAMITQIMAEAREWLGPDQVFAFANNKSKPLFEAMGGVLVEDVMNDLPDEVWKLCDRCPRFEEACAIGKQCCDRVLDITNI